MQEIKDISEAKTKIMDKVYDPENYDPDKFYKNSIEFLRQSGYLRLEESIKPYGGDRYDGLEVDHLEYIATLLNETNVDEETHLRFVVKDVRPHKEVPRIEEVESDDEFDLKPRN